jgi:multidrug efflux pump subunit AcrA (membrane-fusion protein)
MVIVRTDRLRARLAVPERWAGWVQLGATVDFSVQAFPNETFHGRVSRINPSVSQDSRTFDTEALLPNPDGRLKPGFFVQASIPSEKQETTMFLPERAVNTATLYKVASLRGICLRAPDSRWPDQDEHGRRFECRSEAWAIALP